MNGKKKVLFFIDGPVPSEADYTAANALTNIRQFVAFRNAQQVSSSDTPERCDFVAGAVPSVYAKLPRVEGLELPLDFTKPATAVAAPAPAPAAPIVPEAPVVTPETPAPAAPPPPVEVPAPTAEDVEAFSVYNIEAVLGMVQRNEITRERATQLEKLGKNRKTLLQRLTEAVD